MATPSETDALVAPRPRRRERSAAVQRLLAQFRPGLGEPMERRELRAELAAAIAFLAAAIPMALLIPSHRAFSSSAALLLVALYAITLRVEFDVGSGWCCVTELVLIPMLFVLPVGLVPLLVAAGAVAGKAPDYLTGARHPDRVLTAAANSWHAVGPALVLGLAGAGSPHWSIWPLVAAAFAAQLACDLVATVAREWMRLGEPPRLSVQLLGSVWFTDACLAPIGFGVAMLAAHHLPAALITLPLCGLLSFFARDRRASIESALELSRAYRGTALLLGDVVEADDAYTGSHSRDVVELAMYVGPRLGLDDDRLRHLEFAALLHDVGKIAIPKEIINKPGKLTPEERAIINTHTIEGEAMLNNVGGVLAEVGRIVRSCHERWDGQGYPDQLLGEEIPLEARIICACDAFNAMTTDRPYRAARPLRDAIDELRGCAGSHFDPSVVDVLLELYPEQELDPLPPLVIPSASAARI